MRYIKTYRFEIRAKIPFSEWAEIVHRFLEENGLHSGAFLYYLEQWINPEQNSRSACEAAIKDCPSFGTIHYLQDDIGTRAYLSNLSGGEAFDEAQIRPLMKKLHKWYGFSEIDLYYADIDFFQRLIPLARETRPARQNKRLSAPVGSMLHLHRDCLSTNHLDLSIDVLHDGQLLDPDPYLATMKALLPKIRVREFSRFLFTEEERAAMDERAERAADSELSCRSWFNLRLYRFHRKNAQEGRWSVPSAMKRTAQKYGFRYEYPGDSVYLLRKQTLDAHWFQLEILGGPALDVSYISVSLDFQTLGHRTKLFHTTSFAPVSQEDLEAFLDHIIRLIAQFEAELLPCLTEPFPPAPDWFLPLLPWESMA